MHPYHLLEILVIEISDLSIIHFNEFMWYICFSNNSNLNKVFLSPQSIVWVYNLELCLVKCIIWECRRQRSQHHNSNYRVASLFLQVCPLLLLWDCGGHSTWFLQCLAESLLINMKSISRSKYTLWLTEYWCSCIKFTAKLKQFILQVIWRLMPIMPQQW